MNGFSELCNGADNAANPKMFIVHGMEHDPGLEAHTTSRRQVSQVQVRSWGRTDTQLLELQKIQLHLWRLR